MNFPAWSSTLPAVGPQGRMAPDVDMSRLEAGLATPEQQRGGAQAATAQVDMGDVDMSRVEAGLEAAVPGRDDIDMVQQPQSQGGGSRSSLRRPREEEEGLPMYHQQVVHGKGHKTVVRERNLRTEPPIPPRRVIEMVKSIKAPLNFDFSNPPAATDETLSTDETLLRVLEQTLAQVENVRETSQAEHKEEMETLKKEYERKLEEIQTQQDPEHHIWVGRMKEWERQIQSQQRDLDQRKQEQERQYRAQLEQLQRREQERQFQAQQEPSREPTFEAQPLHDGAAQIQIDLEHLQVQRQAAEAQIHRLEHERKQKEEEYTRWLQQQEQERLRKQEQENHDSQQLDLERNHKEEEFRQRLQEEEEERNHKEEEFRQRLQQLEQERLIWAENQRRDDEKRVQEEYRLRQAIATLQTNLLVAEEKNRLMLQLSGQPYPLVEGRDLSVEGGDPFVEGENMVIEDELSGQQHPLVEGEDPFLEGGDPFLESLWENADEDLRLQSGGDRQSYEADSVQSGVMENVGEEEHRMDDYPGDGGRSPSPSLPPYPSSAHARPRGVQDTMPALRTAPNGGGAASTRAARLHDPTERGTITRLIQEKRMTRPPPDPFFTHIPPPTSSPRPTTIGPNEVNNGYIPPPDGARSDRPITVADMHAQTQLLMQNMTVMLSTKNANEHAARSGKRRQPAMITKRQLQAEADTDDENADGDDEKSFPNKIPNLDRTKWKSLLGTVLRAFQRSYEIVKDEEWIAVNPAPPTSCRSFAEGDPGAPEPDPANIRWELGNVTSSWNKRCTELMADHIHTTMGNYIDAEVSRAHVSYAVKLRFKRLLRVWRIAAPDLKNDGNWETVEEVAARVTSQKLEKDHRERQRGRQSTRFDNRSQTCETERNRALLEGKHEQAEVWKYMRRILLGLGVGGQSPDSSESDGHGGRVYYRKRLPFRRKELADHFKTLDIYTQRYQKKKQGNKGPERIPTSQDSDILPYDHMPRNLFDQDWLAANERPKGIRISAKDLPWRNFELPRLP